jgi:hypothetical protein
MKRPSSIEPSDLWERDGSLRDVHVFGASEADWLSLLAISETHRSAYFFDGVQQPLPQLRAIFDNHEGTHLLQIDAGGVQVNCHFFVPEAIELDIDPRQVVDETCHESVLILLEELARSTQKPLVLTPENTPESPCLSFDPKSERWMVHSQTS